MSRQGRLAARFALLLAGSFMFAILLRHSEPAGPQAAEPCFLTRAEAYQYAIARLLAAERLDTAGDPYSSTFTRAYTTVGGAKTDYFLVDDAARELDLAEGFAVHGLVRESLAHYENLLAFYPDTPQGVTARGRIEERRRKTVLGLVRPLSVVVRDPMGHLFVVADQTQPDPFTLDRIEKPWLETAVPHRAPLEAVGFIDDAGSIIRSTSVPSQEEGVVFTPESKGPAFDQEGAVVSGRVYYALTGQSLFSSEREAKRRALAALADPDPGILADAMAYVGDVEEARRIREYPAVDWAGDAERIVADLSSPLYLDARWFLKAQNNPRFTLITKSAVTMGSELPVEIDVAAIESLTFSFAKFEGPMPGTETELKAWLQKAGPSQSHEFTVAVEPGKQTLQLPIRDVGSYRVTVEGRGLSCSFIAVRTDLSLEIFALPGESFVTASRSGITIANAQKPLGTTDDDGFLVPAAPLRGRICEEHRGCCASCDSCAHHHDDRSVTSNPTVFVSGRGQFFRAVAKLDASEVTKVQIPPAGPLLFVHTDRPAYKAGDTLKFRGILRVPKAPLLRKDVARLLPGTEREVAVVVKCGDNTLFSRTYVTGDQGTFAGEFPLPLTAYRSEYSLVVTYEGATIARPFDVMDYRKSDFSIVLTSARDGVRVQAGYVWGAPVPGTTLKAVLGGREVPVADKFVAVKDGETVEVALMRGAEELARKSHVFRAPVEASAPPAVEKPAEARSADPAPDQIVTTLPGAAEEEPKTPLFTVKTDKSLYGRGESIEIVVEGPLDEGEATVLVADLQVYDLVRVPLKFGRGTVKVPVRAILDPGVSIFALCNGYQAKAQVLVRANHMNVAIDAPAKGRPGERVDVVLRADPHAAFALSAVDEAIYMLREDDTPEMYSFFHPARPAALAYARFEAFEFDGETHKVENAPSDPHFKTATPVGTRLFRGKAGSYETIGVGMGGGGGGRYGGRFGGRENLVARGGGSRATESAVLTSLRTLCALQRADGSWPCAYPTEAGTITDTGATGLSLLAFLGAGYSQLSKDEYPDVANPGRTFKLGEVVKRGLAWLLANQSSDGRFGPARGGDPILNHSIAALALSEAYGMTAAQVLLEQAQRGITHLVSLQSANGGWHRADATRNGEMLASTFAVMALKSAQLSEISYPPNAVADVMRFFTESTDSTGLRGQNPSRAEIGGAVASRVLLQRNKADTRVGAAAWLASRSPSWNEGDFLGWYLTSLALFQVDGPDGPLWKAWHDPIKNVLVPNQAKSGSWSNGAEVVYPTAMATLTLQIYYRYANVFGGAGGGRGRDKYDIPLLAAPRVRLHFPDTVFWAPELVADEKGEARVSFTLPDQISTTRLTARGITKGGAAGDAVARIESQQPFFLKIRAPEFAVLDDEIEVRVDLYNYTGSGLQTTVKLEGAEEIRKVHVPPDAPASASWRLRAVDAAGLRLVVHAESGRHQDSMERRIPVHRVGREVQTTVRGKSATGSTYGFEAEKGVQDLVLKIRPQKGSLTQVLDALRYLNQYPYG